MKKMTFFCFAIISVVAIVLSGCGSSGSNSDPAYVGQWSGVTIGGNTVFNLRADHTFSTTMWGSGTIGDRDSLTSANKGTYTFTPDTPGDNTKGTIHFQYTHQYNLSTNIWDSISPTSTWDFPLIINTGVSPQVLTENDSWGFTFTYNGPAATIPSAY